MAGMKTLSKLQICNLTDFMIKSTILKFFELALYVVYARCLGKFYIPEVIILENCRLDNKIYTGSDFFDQ